ncbi:MAG: quinoprotein relay system zinc metallohydrolase 1 [Burkholderiales bacterium]|nr:quinoprotein relay system zinc metallohydrolase 1 [Burkholderiales bacterium]MDE1928822.1 quinoprotein relay system zinc metallohydrolase 1 [Burkholderiales bacterium]MDE2159209.1 quinoprotein relay system zinc metallohydrolase 1 [Burkholderiales bacterium]MDE2503098.1 quinoprotein relay system zinc metallohydrolase 1 [Burkholderiales bacterium]
MRRLALATLIVALVALPIALLPVRAAPAAADAAHFDYRLAAREVGPGVYVIEGANADFSLANGCNIINTGFIVTGAGVIVVNTGPTKLYGEQQRALIARTTDEPILRVVNLDLHPDYFFGNQAYADVPRLATPTTRAGMQRDGAAYEDNLYRLCGDWMRGTARLLPDTDAVPGVLHVGSHTIELRELRGHTPSDLVLIDRGSGVAFVGGLVFSRRIPTTPNAELAPWLASLQTLAGWKLRYLVPSHGDVGAGFAAIDGTRRYLDWLDRAFAGAAAQGLEMNEVLRLPMPAEFRRWGAADTEYIRNVADLYPRYEEAVLQRAR